SQARPIQARLPSWLNRTLSKRTRPSASSVKRSTARRQSRRADPTTKTAVTGSRGRTVRPRTAGNSAARAARAVVAGDQRFYAERRRLDPPPDAHDAVLRARF